MKKLDYALKATTENGQFVVRYLMKQRDCNVVGKMPYEGAENMLKRGNVRVSAEFEGYPLTADGVFFFAAMYRLMQDEGENT